MSSSISEIPSSSLSICVYCAARNSDNPAYEQAAIQVGHWMGKNNIRLVYGGGNTGLMGAVANAVLDAGGQVYGIIPERLMNIEMGHKGLTELKVVQTMHERKQAMIEASDAFLTLPGGIGTFEEFFEAWTWRQLAYHHNPVGLLNVKGYYDGLLQFAQSCINNNFMNQNQMEMLIIENDVNTMMEKLHDQMRTSKSDYAFNGI